MKKKKPKCKNCKHRIFWDERDKKWEHTHYLHNDNCDCRNPNP